MIDKARLGGMCSAALLVAALAVAPAPAGKGVKVKSYKAQTKYSFVNNETEAAVGLKVVLSSAGEVKIEEESGQAGPFSDIRGNGTNTLVLANPAATIEPGSEIGLVFGTYSKKIKVTSWWWLNAKGKRIGKKKKG